MTPHMYYARVAALRAAQNAKTLTFHNRIWTSGNLASNPKRSGDPQLGTDATHYAY